MGSALDPRGILWDPAVNLWDPPFGVCATLCVFPQFAFMKPRPSKPFIILKGTNVRKSCRSARSHPASKSPLEFYQRFLRCSTSRILPTLLAALRAWRGKTQNKCLHTFRHPVISSRAPPMAPASRWWGCAESGRAFLGARSENFKG